MSAAGNLRTFSVVLFCFIYFTDGQSLFSINPSTSMENGCTSTHLLTNSSGVIKYFSSHVQERVCWNINLATRQYITVRLSSIDIEIPSSSRFIQNFLLIQDQYSYISESTGYSRFWFGTRLPGPATFLTNRLQIKLVYNKIQARPPGFQLFYDVDNTCNVRQVIESYTFITSVGYPNSALTDCSWSISLNPESGKIPLEFVLNDCVLLGESWLRVFDGPNASSPLIWKSNCEATASRSFDIGLSSVTTTGPNMFIQFQCKAPWHFKGFNVTVKAKGYCLPGTFSCGDQENCYSSEQKCNGRRDCPSGFDELYCEQCPEGLYFCGDEGCYLPQQHCDGKEHCSNRADEINCKHCAPGAFQCRTKKNCIFERWTCDGTPDCLDKSDEEGCTYTASRQMVTAAIVGSLVCGLLLAVALGCSCKLYALRTATNNRRSRQVVPTPLGRIARQLLQREAPPSYSMTVDGVDSDSPESSLRRSSSSRQRRRGNRERRSRRRRNREPRIRRARVERNENSRGSQDSGQENNSRADDVINDSPNISLPSVPSDSEPIAAPSPTPPAPAPAPVPTSDPPRCESPPVEQAPPLPKKRRIRPVLVEAPCHQDMVEDIPNCVHPNPPSYYEAAGERPSEDSSGGPYDNRRDSEISDQVSESTTLFRRLISRFRLAHKRPLWRSFFGRTNPYRPFNDLENQQPDTVSAETDSVLSMSMLPTVAMETHPSTSAGSGMRTVSSFPPAPLSSKYEDDSDDEEDLGFPNPSSHPFEMRRIPRREVVAKENALPPATSSPLTVWVDPVAPSSGGSSLNMQTSQS